MISLRTDRFVVLIVLVALCLFMNLAIAGPKMVGDRYAFQFFNVKLGQLTRVVLSDVMKVNYVFDSDFLANDDEVSLDLRGLTKDEAFVVLFRLLDKHGYMGKKIGSVVTVEKKRDEKAEEEVFFYRLRYRSLSYIAELIGSLFPDGRFNFQKSAPTSAVPSAAGGAPAGNAGAQVATLASEATQAGTIAATSRGGTPPADADAFFFRGPHREVTRLRGLLEVIDVPAGEVLIKAVVYEVTTGKTDGSAVQLVGKLLAGRVGVSFGPAVGFADSVSFHGVGFDAVASMLSSDSRFKVVSAPSLRVKSGSSGRFTVGNETPVLASVTQQANGGTTQSISYQPSGVILDLKPIVRADGIDLTILQQLSSFAATTTGVNDSPTLTKREISTTVGVRDGETVVLGGLSDDRATEAQQGLSFLPKWLHSRTRTADRIEVLLVLDVNRL